MFKNVLIPIDVTVPQEAQTLLAAAKAMTADWNCALHVVTVAPDVGMAIVGSYFDEGVENKALKATAVALTKAVADAGVEAQTHMLTGKVYDRVLSLSKDMKIDLIVIGAHRPGIRDYLLGTNAARLVRHADASVMVIRD